MQNLVQGLYITEPISSARTLIPLQSTDPNFLSFKAGRNIKIFSKSISGDLWEGESEGKRGFFPKHYVKELKTFVKDPQFRVFKEVIHFLLSRA